MSEKISSMIGEMAERWGDDVGYWKNEAEKYLELYEVARQERDTAETEIARLREGLSAAIRAARLALFVIEKENVMLNESWQAGFEKDLRTAESARAALNSGE